MTQNTVAVGSPAQRRSAHVIHYNLSYLVQGTEHGTDGAIVLLHDILAGAFAWTSIMPQLAATNRAVYAIDMLGYGQSERPWPADPSIWGHANCLNMLFEQLQLTNIVLVGFGIGGGVAQVLATRLSRDRVAALVLIDSIAYDYSFAPDWPLPDMRKRQEYNAAKETSVEDMMKALRETVPQGSHYPNLLTAALGEYIEGWDSELGKEVLYQHIRLLIPNYINAVTSDLKMMEKPALILWGANDQQAPLKLAHRLHRDIPNSQLVTIPDAGHMALFDNPIAIARALNDFIAGL